MKAATICCTTLMAATTSAFAAGMPVGCPDFEVELPRDSGGAVVHAADFGFSETNRNNIVAVNSALSEARRIGASRVELAPGTYRCFARVAGESGIVIEGFEDFTFDGKGAALVFRRGHAPVESQDTLLENGANVTVRNCRRTVVENFNMDWDWERDPLAVWARCVDKHVDEADNSSYADFDLERPHPKYPEHVPVQLLTPFTLDKSGSKMDAGNGPRYYLGTSFGNIGAKSEWISPTRLRVWPGVRPDYGYSPRAQAGYYSPKNNSVQVGKMRTGGIYSISHAYYGLNGFVLDSNRHFTLKDVDVWACKGFGIETRGSQKYWQLVNVNIRQKPGELRPVTSTADAHHIVRSQGFGKMIGCEVTMNQDDYFNYHDRTQIAQTRGPRSVEVVNSRGLCYAGFVVGEAIRLKNEDFSNTGWVGNIIGIDGEFITFDRDLPEQKGILFVLVRDDSVTENFVFRDCFFHDSPWSRGIVQGNNVTIEGCRFGPMSGSALTFSSCYTYNVWCEGTGCSNIVVRNCRFENCLCNSSWNSLAYAPLIKASLIIPPAYSRMKDSVPIFNEAFAREVAVNNAVGRRVEPASDAVCDILIENNEILNPRGLLLLVENASRVTFRNNKVEFDGKGWDPLPCVGKIRLTGGRDNDVPSELVCK